MFQQTRRSKERKEEELEWGVKKKSFSFEMSLKFPATVKGLQRVRRIVKSVFQTVSFDADYLFGPFLSGSVSRYSLQ